MAARCRLDSTRGASRLGCRFECARGVWRKCTGYKYIVFKIQLCRFVHGAGIGHWREPSVGSGASGQRPPSVGPPLECLDQRPETGDKLHQTVRSYRVLCTPSVYSPAARGGRRQMAGCWVTQGRGAAARVDASVSNVGTGWAVIRGHHP